jgi:glycerol-3-phosphate cytidylyltransferase
MYSENKGFTCSTFDLLHAGHILMLKEIRELCDYLIVGLQTDPTIDRPDTKNKPIQSVVERRIQLEAVKYVDEIVVYDTEKDLEDIFMVYPISTRFLGKEYKGRDFTAKKLCMDLGIKVHYNSRNHNFSSTELRERVYAAEKARRKEK